MTVRHGGQKVHNFRIAWWLCLFVWKSCKCSFPSSQTWPCYIRQGVLWCCFDKESAVSIKLKGMMLADVFDTLTARENSVKPPESSIRQASIDWSADWDGSAWDGTSCYCTTRHIKASAKLCCFRSALNIDCIFQELLRILRPYPKSNVCVCVCVYLCVCVCVCVCVCMYVCMYVCIIEKTHALCVKTV